MNEEQIHAVQAEVSQPEQSPSNEPSAADLDAVAAEQEAAAATGAAGVGEPPPAETQLAEAGAEGAQLTTEAALESPANLQELPAEPLAAEAPKPAPMCRCGATLKPSSQSPSFNYECPAISCKLRWLVTDSGQECIGRGAVA